MTAGHRTFTVPGVIHENDIAKAGVGVTNDNNIKARL